MFLIKNRVFSSLERISYHTPGHYCILSAASVVSIVDATHELNIERNLEKLVSPKRYRAFSKMNLILLKAEKLGGSFLICHLPMHDFQHVVTTEYTQL